MKILMGPREPDAENDPFEPKEALLSFVAHSSSAGSSNIRMKGIGGRWNSMSEERAAGKKGSAFPGNGEWFCTATEEGLSNCLMSHTLINWFALGNGVIFEQYNFAK